MALFARVAALGSLSAVAREREVPVSQVSRTLARLEKACGARLMHRSTHGLSLSEEGKAFLAYCRRTVDTLEEMEGEFATRSGEPSGLVRVASSTVVAQYQLVPSLPGLAARYPGLQVELEVGDRLLDLAREGIDIAVRAASVPDTVVARQVGTLDRRLYAAPAYASAHGLPRRPQDLADHQLVTNSGIPALNEWTFSVDGAETTVAAQGRWRASDTNMAAAMVLQGLGIGRMTTLVADVLVGKQLLLPVLADFIVPHPVPVYAVTTGGRHRLPKIKACLDYWTEWFGRSSAR
jgi:DNA-binding transcriptional LysR family regulator